MRRLLNTLILLALSLSLCQAQEKPFVVATASMLADMAKQVGGDLIRVQSIVPIGGDPHIYDPTPSAAQMAADADLVLRNGLTFEGWLNDLIENSGTEADIVTVTDGIKPIESLTYENASDPHAWMDVSLGILYVKNIRDALFKLLPDNRSEIEANYNSYLIQLQDLDQYIKEKIQTIPEGKRILITSHDAFQYYGRRYGIQLESILGTSTDADVQTSDIIRLNKVIRESNVPALFVESTINPKLLEQIASDNDISIGGKLYADSLGDEESEAGTYLGMLRYDTDVIVEGLTREKKETPEDTKSNTSTLFLGFAMLLVLGIVLAVIGFRLQKGR